MNLVRDLINAVGGVGAAGKVLSLNASKETDHVVSARAVDFTENGLTTYTGNIEIPAGAYIIDVIVQAVALWDDGTAASMIVGDVADPNGFYDAVDLKATDLILAEAIGLAFAGGVEGAYSTGTLTQWKGLYSATKRTITGVITTTDQDGTTGRTRMIVVYVVPTSASASGV